jgi:hypothetical protein
MFMGAEGAAQTAEAGRMKVGTAAPPTAASDQVRMAAGRFRMAVKATVPAAGSQR